MPDRRDRAKHAGIGNEDVEFTPAFVDRATELVDRRHVGKVEGHQRRRAAHRLDRVVEFFETADGAGAGNHMGSGLGQFESGEIADTARCAGDHGHPAFEIDRHFSV